MTQIELNDTVELQAKIRIKPFLFSLYV